MSRIVSGRALSALLATLGYVLLGASTAGPARADAGWFETGDVSLRVDLELLNDARVIRLPVTQWPIPRAAVRYALANARTHFATNAAVSAALARVRARAVDPTQSDRSAVRFAGWADAGDAGLLRDFGTLDRDNGSIGALAAYDGDRFAAQASVATVFSPDDDRPVRADGSHATVALGNWLVSAHTLEQWFGAGHGSSLILSNNARPMPTLMLERAEARPFEASLLRWLGPWRFSLGVGQMEEHRRDIDAPLFMSWRVTVMPFRDIELGFSRTAQFCGKQLRCDLNTFGNMLAGNDNVGIDATRANEPGNQMAGFDIRWTSPIGSGPYTVYAQYIGEDEASYLPVKYLGLMGAEIWKPFADGSVAQLYLEYANTTCSALAGRKPRFNCAYNQGRFNSEGYRFHGRVVGHTTDSDSESFSAGLNLNRADGTVWSLKAWRAHLNHDGYDPRNSTSAAPTDYSSLEIGWQGRVFGQPLAAQLGIESLEPQAGGGRDTRAFGFLGWHREFTP